MALNIFVGLLRHAGNVPTIVSAQEWPVFLPADEHANRHLAQLRGTSSSSASLALLLPWNPQTPVLVIWRNIMKTS